jgi:hypothetical protein
MLNKTLKNTRAPWTPIVVFLLALIGVNGTVFFLGRTNILQKLLLPNTLKMR